MKKRTKFALGGLTVLLGAFALSGCTQSFCSINDQANMLYAYDYGVTNYYSADDTNKPAEATVLSGFDSVYIYSSISNSPCLRDFISTAESKSLKTPSLNYWATLDQKVLENALSKQGITTYSSINVEGIISALDEFGYLKFADSSNNSSLWNNWDLLNNEVRQIVPIDECPTADFISNYKATMNSYVANNRSCLAISDGEYGFYGYGSDKKPVQIEAKTWKYAWSKGLFEGLLVWPVGALLDVFVKGLKSAGAGAGWAQILALLFVTIIVRALMLLITFKQTTGNAKMTALQPEIAKLQAKYPNSNTNTYERQRLAEETSRLYKKNKINPFTTLLVMIVQFPVFICVWGALQGNAYLSSDSFMGLYLSDTISSVLFNKASWQSVNGYIPALTALILFLLMSGAQAASMLIPQFLQKKKAKKIAKLGKNPAQKSQDNKMKWFTYIMLIMIIVMGFSLASAMGFYWLIGALISLAQTLITNSITEKKSKNNKKR